MQPLLLNVDWLAVSVRFNESDFSTLPAGHFFVECDGTNVWKLRRIVFNEHAEKVATILYAPKSSLIPANAGLIEIANEWLYHGRSPMAILDDLRQWRIFDVTGISRVDLAVDFNPTTRQWHHIQCLADGRDYVAGKRSRTPWYGVVRCPLLADRYQGVEIPYDQSWGHKTTAVKWKLYYKSKELADAFGGKLFAKPYILDCWDEVGLDRRDVWRLEVSIHGGNSLEFKDEPITLDRLKHDPRGIFSALYSRRFIVRRNEGHKDRTNDRVVDFLPVQAGDKLRTARPKATGLRNPTITLLRHLLTAIENEDVLCADDIREETLASMSRIIAVGHLGNYFRAIVGEEFDTYCETTRLRADALRSSARYIERMPMADVIAAIGREKWLKDEEESV